MATTAAPLDCSTRQVPIHPVPTFTKGTITIAACICAHNGDVTGDGVIDVFDVVYLIDYVFSGGPAPCNPCACSPYPTNCA